MRKVYTAAFKAIVARELLKEEQTLAQLSAAYGVQPRTLRAWRQQALRGLPAIFAHQDELAAMEAAHARHLKEFATTIGRLTADVTALHDQLRAASRTSDAP